MSKTYPSTPQKEQIEKNLITTSTAPAQFKDYPSRWVMMVLFFMPNMMNGIGWITFSPISSQIETAYDQSQFAVTMTSLVYMVLYVFVNFPSNYYLGKSLRTGIWIGSILTLVGGWVRIFINTSFWWAVLGQVIAGIGQPFILNAPSKIAAVWFKQEQRPIATAILALINTIGVGIGFLFSSFFVDTQYSSDTRNQVENMLFWQAVIMTISIIPCIVFFKEKPPTPPSPSAEADKMAFSESLRQIIKDKNFIKIFLAFGCVLGNFNAIATLINFYLEQYNFSSDETSYFGAMFILSGLIGSFLICDHVQKTFQYKKVMVRIGIASVIFYALQMGMLVLEGFWPLLIAIFLMGFFTTPLIPLSMDFVCETTFPIAEPFSSGLILSSGQLFGVILISVATYGISLDTKTDVMISQAIGLVLLIIGTILYAMAKEDLKRKQHEHEVHQNNESGKYGDNEDGIFQQPKVINGNSNQVSAISSNT